MVLTLLMFSLIRPDLISAKTHWRMNPLWALSEQAHSFPVLTPPNSLTWLISLSPDLFPPLLSLFQCCLTGKGPRSFLFFSILSFLMQLWANTHGCSTQQWVLRRPPPPLPGAAGSLCFISLAEWEIKLLTVIACDAAHFSRSVCGTESFKGKIGCERTMNHSIRVGWTLCLAPGAAGSSARCFLVSALTLICGTKAWLQRLMNSGGDIEHFSVVMQAGRMKLSFRICISNWVVHSKRHDAMPWWSLIERHYWPQKVKLNRLILTPDNHNNKTTPHFFFFWAVTPTQPFCLWGGKFILECDNCPELGTVVEMGPGRVSFYLPRFCFKNCFPFSFFLTTRPSHLY